MKSLATMYFDCVLAMYNTVPLVPGEVTLTGFDTTGLPFPNNPIWLMGAGLQEGGSQIAKMDALPARVGVIVLPAGIVSGAVVTYWRFKPVNATPFVSTAVAISGC